MAEEKNEKTRNVTHREMLQSVIVMVLIEQVIGVDKWRPVGGMSRM
jgi:hypothetical protein